MKTTLGALLTTTLAYAVLGILGLALAIPPGYASPVFPAAGLAVALALYFGNRILPGIWLGSLLVNLAVAWHNGKLDATSMGIAAVVASGAVLQTWAARWLIMRWLGDQWRRLETEKDIALFLAVGAPLPCLISATIGTCALYGAGVVSANEFVYSWWNWCLGDTLGVLIFAPLTLLALLRKASPWKERLFTVSVPMLVTLCLVTVSFLGVSQRQQKMELDKIADHGALISRLLDKRFVAHQEALAALKRLIEVMPDMTFTQFEYFTQITLQDNTDIFALSFNPYVLDPARRELEHSMAMKTDKASFSIMERNSQQELVPAPQRPVYVPVGFIAPLEGNRPAAGFNIHSEPIRRDAIERAITAESTAVTAPIQLVQEAQKRIGVLVLTPAYRQAERGTEKLIGFAVGVFKIDEMVQIATQNRVPPGFVFRLTDLLAAPDRNLLFQSDGGQNKPIGPYVWRTQLMMADRQWNFEIFPTEEYLRQQHSVLALAVGMAGLLFATLLQIMLLAMTGRTSVIQQKVDEQTVELMQAKEAAEASEAQLRGITSSANDAIIMMNPQGAISYWNPAAERILGYSSEEALGHNLHTMLVPEQYLAPHKETYPEFQRTGRGNAVGKTLEMFARKKDGSVIPITVSMSALLLNGMWHAVGIVHDISKRKRYEAELEQAREAAEAASRAKSEFLATMSHEIRTPMNGVIGMTGILLDTELTTEQREAAEIVRKSAESLLGVINDILDFSKIEAGKLDLEILDFDLRTTMQDIAELLALRAAAAGLELICQVDPEVPSLLRGDPGRLRQIITNLTGNALKFTHKGNVSIKAALCAETDGAVVLRFEIQDTGIGIPPSRLTALFNPFTQVDASTSRKYGGTGLGLAICKQLAELMGGEIGVRSEEGKGSTFWFTSRFELQLSHVATTVKISERADISGTKILVVDDNATNHLRMITLLSSWGCRCEAAHDGDAGLARLREAAQRGAPFDIALIDQQMPEMDGAELGRKIKEDPALHATLMVMLTSIGHRGDAAMLEQIGFVGYLVKPLQDSQLYGCLTLVVEKAAGEVANTKIVTRHTVAESAKHGVRILLAEDNITNQIVAQKFLNKLGYKADVVANGQEAVSALQLIPYDLVLMDCMMPEMDGLQATGMIRDASSPVLNHAIPIIAMTANAMQGDREKCLQAGMDDYMSKPLSVPALAGLLDKWLLQETRAARMPAPSATDGAEKLIAAGENETPVFDLVVMRTRMMDDDALVREIAAGFLGEMPGKIALLKRCLEKEDLAGVHFQAHAIKGGAATVCGGALKEVALAMEQAGKAGDVNAARALMTNLATQFDMLQQAMTKIL